MGGEGGGAWSGEPRALDCAHGSLSTLHTAIMLTGLMDQWPLHLSKCSTLLDASSPDAAYTPPGLYCYCNSLAL